MPPKLPRPAAVVRRLSLAWNVLRTGRAPAAPAKAARRQDFPSITPEEVADARRFFPRDKFFIFGHARSGTTLLARLVRLHPAVHCNYQAHFFTRPPLLQGLASDPDVAAWLARRSNRWNEGRDLTPLALRAAADMIMERQAAALGKAIVGDKSPNSLLDGEAVRLMQRVYPDGRLVFIVRDGRDTALSHRFQAFIDNPNSLSPSDQEIRAAFSANPAPFLSGERSLFTPKGLRAAAQGWQHNLDDTDTQARLLYPDKYFPIRYEDLLATPWDELCRLWDFLGAPLDQSAALQAAVQAEMTANPDADWQQEKAAEIASPIQKGVQGSWKQVFTPQDRQIFEELAGETLRAWRYEA